MAGSKRRAEADPCESEDERMPLQPTKCHRLDQSRAVQCMQHVTALNTQFTSWVEKQLSDHPNELWQEGLEDYLRHASKILTDFSDVVEWLKANASISKPSEKGSEFHAGDGGLIREFTANSVEESLNAKKSTLSMGFSVMNVATGYTQINTQIARPFEEDGDASNEPSSPSLKRLEEPGVKMVHEVKCKLYIKADAGAEKGWKDMGMGHLTIKCRENTERGTREAKAAIMFRNDVGRVLLNALLYSNIKMNIQKNTVTGIFHSAETEASVRSEAPKARLYLLKLKTQSEAEQLVEAITLHAPAAD